MWCHMTCHKGLNKRVDKMRCFILHSHQQNDDKKQKLIIEKELVKVQRSSMSRQGRVDNSSSFWRDKKPRVLVWYKVKNSLSNLYCRHRSSPRWRSIIPVKWNQIELHITNQRAHCHCRPLHSCLWYMDTSKCVNVRIRHRMVW